jgi:SH3-like domain-containing protein
LSTVLQRRDIYWEIIADNLKKRGWSLSWMSAVDSEGRTIWIADAHRDEKRSVVRADEKQTASLELESAILPGEWGSEPATDTEE